MNGQGSFDEDHWRSLQQLLPQSNDHHLEDFPPISQTAVVSDNSLQGVYSSQYGRDSRLADIPAIITPSGNASDVQYEHHILGRAGSESSYHFQELNDMDGERSLSTGAYVYRHQSHNSERDIRSLSASSLPANFRSKSLSSTTSSILRSAFPSEASDTELATMLAPAEGPHFDADSITASIASKRPDSPPEFQIIKELGYHNYGYGIDWKQGHTQITDHPDMTTVHYGTKILLRGYEGHYLATEESDSDLKDSPPFILTPCGMGVGDGSEVFTLYDANARDNRGPARFGDTIMVRGAGAHDRYLSYQDHPRIELGLWRSMTSHPEKWTLLKADNHRQFQGSLTKRYSQATGMCLRAGDKLVLKAFSGGQILTLAEARDGAVLTCTEPEGFPTECQTWQVVLSGSPCYPSWNQNRPFLSTEFLLTPNRGVLTHADTILFGAGRQAPKTLPLTPLLSYPVQVQEQLLMEDLLSVLMGFEGRYIRVSAPSDSESTARAQIDQVQFVLDPELCNKSLAYAVDRILPLAHCYVNASHFCREHSRYEYGLVSQAFAAAVRVLLKEYLLLVAQLEHQLLQGNLTVQKLWFFVQPSLQTMEVLDELIQSVHTLTGGRLLNVLHDTLKSSGNEKLCQIYVWLLHQASAPYLEMLASWIYNGELDDPHEEFMVQEDPAMKNKEIILQDFNASYWDQKYTVRENCVVSFLSQHAQKILTTGKYLNVIRECQREVDCPFAQKMSYALGEARYGELVNKAYAYASERLLNLVLKEQQLLARLRSMKHYFFLDQGDFFVYFMDIAEEELQLDVAQISQTRMETLLLLAIQSSSVSEDPYRENVACEFATYNLIHHLDAIHNYHTDSGASSRGIRDAHAVYGSHSLKGIEAFMLDYQVTWPLSIVVSKKVLIKYQILFRHLFFCKHVERKLLDTWLDHQVTKELNLRFAMGPTYGLRHRMLHFVQNFVYYMMFEAIEPLWHDLEERMSNVKTVDEILKHHDEFLDSSLDRCLLTKQDLLKILTKLLKTCQLFFRENEKLCKNK